MPYLPHLYSGTNSNDRLLRVTPPKHGRQITHLARHFTTHAGEAMTRAFLTAREYNGKMAVIVLPEWTAGYFMMRDRGGALNRHEEDAEHWQYDFRNRGSHDPHHPDSIEQRTLKIYDEEDMAQFVDGYCRHKREEHERLEMYLRMLGEERVKKG